MPPISRRIASKIKSEAGLRQPRWIPHYLWRPGTMAWPALAGQARRLPYFLIWWPSGTPGLILIIHLAHAAVAARHWSFLLLLRDFSHETFGREQQASNRS